MADDFKHLVSDRRAFLYGLGATAIGVAAGSRPGWAQDEPVDCAPIGVTPKTPVVPFAPQTSLPVRIRKSAFELSKTEVDRLKAAYAALRKLSTDDPNDPRGWLRQSYVHCWYCGGGSDGKAGEEIHGSWLFFPWHRAYLYFHERILATLIGDDSFALPYWDWDSEGRQTFPSVYGDPGDPSNPLFDLMRSAKPGNAIPANVVGTRIMDLTMNSKNANLFMGTQAGSAGAMERQPHGPVHIWTGDITLQSAAEDMGVLATAARDPVFFAHHDNIDRLWGIWLGLAPTHQNPNSSAWTGHKWTFYNEKKQWTQIAISDVIDTVKSLRYDFQPPTPKPIWTFTPSARVAAVHAALPAAAAAPVVVANDAKGFDLGAAAVTKSVKLPGPKKGLHAALAPVSSVLHIDGITVPHDDQALFEVYLDLPDAKPEDVDKPNFLGTVTVLAKSKKVMDHAHLPTKATFELSPEQAQAVQQGGDLSVTLVPYAAPGATPKAHAVKIGKIYIQNE